MSNAETMLSIQCSNGTWLHVRRNPEHRGFELDTIYQSSTEHIACKAWLSSRQIRLLIAVLQMELDRQDCECASKEGS